MKEYLDSFVNNLPKDFTKTYGWAVEITVALFFATLLCLILYLITSRLNRSNRDYLNRSVMYSFVKAAFTPVILAIWVATLSFIITILNKEFKLDAIKDLPTFKTALYAVLFGWFLLRFKRMFISRFSMRHPNISLSSIDMIDKILSAVIVLITLLLILPTFGFNLNGLLAFGGIGGIIVGLAAQNTLSNFFGAMQIHLDKPFGIGDWVILPEKNIEGIVEHIGWRQIIVRSFDKRQMFVPNSLISSVVLVNPSRMTHRRIKETIGIRYDDIEKIEVITSEIKQYLDNHKLVDHGLDVVVNLDSFGESSVNFILSAFTRENELKDFMAFKQDVLLAIYKIIKKHGADIAYPTSVQYHIDSKA